MTTKKFLALILCLSAGWANAAADLRVFQGTSGANWPRLEAQLTESGRISPEGVIDSAVLGGIAVQTAIDRGILKNPTDDERQVYGMTFLVNNGIGPTIHRDEFRSRGQDKKGFQLPDRTVVKQLAAEAAVPAASAPALPIATPVTVVPLATLAASDALAAEVATLRTQLNDQKVSNDADIARLTGAAKEAAQLRADQLSALEKKFQDEVAAGVKFTNSSSQELNAGLRVDVTKGMKAIRTELQALNPKIAALEQSTFVRFGGFIWVAMVLAFAIVGGAACLALYRTKQFSKKTAETVKKEVAAAMIPVRVMANTAETVSIGASGVANSALGRVNQLKGQLDALAEHVPTLTLDGTAYYNGGREALNQVCEDLAEGETHCALIEHNGLQADVIVRKTSGGFYILSGILSQQASRPVKNPAARIASAARDNDLVFSSAGLTAKAAPVGAVTA